MLTAGSRSRSPPHVVVNIYFIRAIQNRQPHLSGVITSMLLLMILSHPSSILHHFPLYTQSPSCTTRKSFLYPQSFTFCCSYTSTAQPKDNQRESEKEIIPMNRTTARKRRINCVKRFRRCRSENVENTTGRTNQERRCRTRRCGDRSKKEIRSNDRQKGWMRIRGRFFSASKSNEK